jgi:hypothetical protein
MNQDYWQGQGGPCAVLRDGDGAAGPGNVNASYWCQENGRVGRQYFFRQPRGLTLSRAQLPHAPYAAAPANGAVLHYWRPAHWYSAFARVGAAATDPATNATALAWTHGGFHGAEGTDVGEDWYLSHVREELDAPREFFFDAAAQKLYYFHNDSAGVPPPARPLRLSSHRASGLSRGPRASESGSRALPPRSLAHRSSLCGQSVGLPMMLLACVHTIACCSWLSVLAEAGKASAPAGGVAE